MATKDITRERIKQFMIENPGIRASEIATALSISASTAHVHIRAIRAEWKDK
jgi:predicted transcriptional regulator